MKVFVLRIALSLILGFFFIIIISKFINLSSDVWCALIVGTTCAIVYVMSSFFSFYYAYTLNQTSFNRVFVFSITGRILLLLCIITLIVKFTNLNTLVFIISFFIWYFIFQILEVICLKKLSTKKV
jgi:hypothetical protein